MDIIHHMNMEFISYARRKSRKIKTAVSRNHRAGQGYAVGNP